MWNAHGPKEDPKDEKSFPGVSSLGVVPLGSSPFTVEGFVDILSQKIEIKINHVPGPATGDSFWGRCYGNGEVVGPFIQV
jgi:hypothetical protein